MTISKQASTKNTPIFIYLVLCLLIFLHVGRGVITLLVLFPFLSTSSKNNHIQRWSKRLLKIFGVELHVNHANLLPQCSYLLAANHVSWMDIHAINAFAQSGQINVADFETPVIIDQSLKFNGNTVLRGGQIPRVDKNSLIIS